MFSAPTPRIAAENLQTQNVFLVVIDGVRYSETFGDPTHQFIPHIWSDLKPLGTIYTSFYNKGKPYTKTVTVPGHSNLLTGAWQNIGNDAKTRPTHPTMFEYYRKQLGVDEAKTWVIVQHSNLFGITYSTHPQYGSGCGASLDSPALRKMKPNTDQATWKILQEAMDKHHPSLVLVNLGETDSAGHSEDWARYVNAIRNADNLVYQLWLRLQSDASYRDRTVLVVTNDHGRHLDGIKDGFRSHGDDCEGCRHVMLLALGPNIKQNYVVDAYREQIDICPTIGFLLGFATPFSTGDIMSEMLATQTPEPLILTSVILAAAIIVSVILAIVAIQRRREAKNS